MAKNKDVLARTDLADNKYSAEDPRVVSSTRSWRRARRRTR